MERALDERSYDAPLSQRSAAELALAHRRRDVVLDQRERARESRIAAIIWLGFVACLVAWLILGQ